MVCVLRGQRGGTGQGEQCSACSSLVVPSTHCWFNFPREVGLGHRVVRPPPPPVGPGPALPAGDEFDPDDSAVGNNVLRKAFRKLFV